MDRGCVRSRKSRRVRHQSRRRASPKNRASIRDRKLYGLGALVHLRRGVRYWAKIPFEWRLAIIEVALCVIFQAAFALWLLRFFAASEVSGIGVVFKAVFTGFVVIVGAIGGAISGIFYCGAWALASVALKRRRQVVEEEE